MSHEWSLSSEVRELLVCPVCRGELKDNTLGLACTQDQLIFPVRDGIPMMLEELALPLNNSKFVKRS